MLKTALISLSIIVCAFGLFLTGAYFFDNFEGGIPVIALLTGLALMIQGGYTIGYAGGAFDSWKEWAAQLFVSGEAASVLAGSLAAVQGFLYNMHPKNDDFEFAPMILGACMTAQAVLGLLYAKTSERRAVT